MGVSVMLEMHRCFGRAPSLRSVTLPQRDMMRVIWRKSPLLCVVEGDGEQTGRSTGKFKFVIAM